MLLNANPPRRSQATCFPRPTHGIFHFLISGLGPKATLQSHRLVPRLSSFKTILCPFLTKHSHQSSPIFNVSSQNRSTARGVAGETYLWEVGRDDCAVGELPAGQGPQRLCRRLGRLKLDKDLAHAGGLPAAAGRPGDLDGEDGAKFLALFLDVVTNFWRGQSV